MTLPMPDDFDTCGQCFALSKRVRGMPRHSRYSRFNKARYVGVMGQSAMHVFDFEKMDFIVSDPTRGLDVIRNKYTTGYYDIDDEN